MYELFMVIVILFMVFQIYLNSITKKAILGNFIILKEVLEELQQKYDKAGQKFDENG